MQSSPSRMAFSTFLYVIHYFYTTWLTLQVTGFFLYIYSYFCNIVCYFVQVTAPIFDWWHNNLLQAPVNYISLHCVKPSLRPLSMAISTVSIHIFGDVPSSPLVGILQVCAPKFRWYMLTDHSFLVFLVWIIFFFLWCELIYHRWTCLNLLLFCECAWNLIL